MTLLCGPAVKSSAESHGTEKWLLANEMDGKMVQLRGTHEMLGILQIP
jgi:hypothetical protein